MSEQLVNSKTDLSKFSVEDIVNRMPPNYRAKLRERLTKAMKSGDKVRVYSDGVFDCFHSGHARLLEQIKKMLPNVEVVAGVCSDEDTIREKGLVVMREQERIDGAAMCKWADEVYFPAPWYPTMEHLRSINCDFIAHDTIPYAVEGIEDCYAGFKENGFFLPTLRSEGISTSDIIKRIVADRSEYISRNLKKGQTADDLNLDLYECVKYGAKPANTNVINKAINWLLAFKLVAKLDVVRCLAVKTLCSKKKNKVKTI